MNLRLIGSSAGAVVLASLLGACGASQQQDPQCVVAKAVTDGSTGSFATSYTLKDGQDANLSCAHLKPEAVGLEKFFNQDPLGKDSVAIRTTRVGALLEDAASDKPSVEVDPDAPKQPHSVGELATAAPGSDNFCEVPSLNPTQLAVRSTTSGGSSLSLTYAWSNLRIYNTPGIPGTQFVADLSYTENGCKAEFKVKGIWPVVSCGTKVDGKTVPDESKCDPKPAPPTRLRGSGINPLFPVQCDPEAFICVLTGEVPSDKP